MTAIPVTADNIRSASPNTDHIRSFTAAETIAAGATVTFDLTAGTAARGVIYNTDISDSDRRNVIGIALSGGASGDLIAVALPCSLVTGYDFSPSDTAAHRNGNLVYSADAGLDDTQGTGSIPVGIIMPVGNSGQGVLVLPDYSNVGS